MVRACRRWCAWLDTHGLVETLVVKMSEAAPGVRPLAAGVRGEWVSTTLCSQFWRNYCSLSHVYVRPVVV